MADEFKPINTQEEFDARVAEVYGDVKGLQGQITTLTGERDTLQAKVKGFEVGALRKRIAMEKGIPAEMADRITGETEADIRKDADAVAKLVKTIKGPAPLFDPDGKQSDPKTADLRNMLSELRGE